MVQSGRFQYDLVGFITYMFICFRWRPKRASDTLLCHDENHTGASESSSFKIRRGTSLSCLYISIINVVFYKET